MFYVFHLMAVNCSNRIKKKIENQSFCLVHLHFTFLYNVFLLPIVFTIPFFGFTFSLGFFYLLVKVGLPPHHGFCFLSQVHVAQIQIAAGGERPSVGTAGQPALQAGVWGQNQQPPARSGRALQAAVKRSFSHLFSGLFFPCLEESRRVDPKRRKGLGRDEWHLRCQMVLTLGR